MATETPTTETPTTENKPKLVGILKTGYDLYKGQNRTNLKSDEKRFLEGMIHYVQTDHASPRPNDVTAPIKPNKNQCYKTPQGFVNTFAGRYKAFGVITDAKILIRLVKNLNAEIVKEFYEEKITEATRGLSKIDKVAYIDKLLADLKVFKFGWSFVSIDDIQYCPGLTKKEFETIPKFIEETLSA